ncbi:hypothetical protein [Xanthomonas translucens]|uniref:hypothetical protein n=1 Tax=Xanthomonas campestris pv. translucens TaxID=343 RepID=UPI0012D8F1B0|nr:hypothetical protein [Xanthomonas translucens]
MRPGRRDSGLGKAGTGDSKRDSNSHKKAPACRRFFCGSLFESRVPSPESRLFESRVPSPGFTESRVPSPESRLY